LLKRKINKHYMYTLFTKFKKKEKKALRPHKVGMGTMHAGWVKRENFVSVQPYRCKRVTNRVST